MIYVGIDDTDILGSPGTNKLARHLIERLRPDYANLVAIRHQLLFDPRVPYTSKNSSASLLFDVEDANGVLDLARRIRSLMLEWYVAGSDPGLCVTDCVPQSVSDFGRRCQKEVVSQQDARQLAAESGIHLEGLGGTEDGVIGALAAVGLAAAGDDGRVVSIRHWPDDLSGPQDAGFLHHRGVAEIRCVETGRMITCGTVDVGKHLRPNFRCGKVVLFVAASHAAGPSEVAWTAVRFT
ncbi:MAG: ABC transporter substrate-binding protein [Pirellulales bacterium]|nr:ABC transporter substrate-binding protein [Pirellulales bacterium]